MSDTYFGGASDPVDGANPEDPSESVAEAPRPGLISSSSAPGTDRASELWAESKAAAEQAAADAAAEPAPVDSPAIELTAIEARVLGAMIEKSYLTPDIYPMTTNALVTACNQKTNRDPVVSYSAVQIDSTLIELRGRNLVRRVHAAGSRSTKHRQTLDEALTLDERQLALISVLLLRGPQTIGELRLRTERHEVGFDDLGAVEDCLEGLASRANPLVHQLPRRPGHKENRWQHLLGAASETESAGSIDDTGSSPVQVSAEPDSPAPSASIASAPTPPTAVADHDLVQQVNELEREVATLRRQLATLADKLGEPLE